MIDQPGIYLNISAKEYHADPCPAPSLSRGIAQMLVERSPMHAFHNHPRLTPPDPIDESGASRVMDMGSVVHSMVLGRGASVVPLSAVYGAKHDRAGEPVTDYATKAAKEERQALRDAGYIPILPHELPLLQRASASVVRMLHAHEDGGGFFAPGQSEAVVVWREGDLWLRCMVDRLPDDPMLSPYDLKMTKLSANPVDWCRRYRSAYAFQDAFYRRGIAAVRGITPPPMRFVVGELDAPHGVSVMTSAPSLEAIANAQVDRAIQLWEQCIRNNRWPGYPAFTAHIEATAWQLTEMDEQALRDEIMEAAQ
jgi:hypothetical protein